MFKMKVSQHLSYFFIEFFGAYSLSQDADILSVCKVSEQAGEEE